MQRIPTRIDGPVIVEPPVFGDDRGFFMESWNQATFARAGLDLEILAALALAPMLAGHDESPDGRS